MAGEARIIEARLELGIRIRRGGDDGVGVGNTMQERVDNRHHRGGGKLEQHRHQWQHHSVLVAPTPDASHNMRNISRLPIACVMGQEKSTLRAATAAVTSQKRSMESCPSATDS